MLASPHHGRLDEHDKAKFEELHRSIKTCDDILSSVEFNLTSFRNDLAAVSADIETLQARSTALNVRLENRRAVEKGLGPVVEEISVSPVVVSKIADGHIDETWVKALAEVDKRATLYKNGPGQNQSKAWTDLGPLLDKLTTKVGRSMVSFPFILEPPLADTSVRRLSNEYETFSLPRSKLCGPLTSMPKSYNSRTSSGSRTSMPSSTGTSQLSQKRYVRPT
jgi:hypothetical protein